MNLMSRSSLSRLGGRLLAAIRRSEAAELDGARHHSSSSTGGRASAATAAAVRQQRPFQQQQRHGRRQILADPVSLPRGALLAGSVALLVGGAAIGAQADRLARQAEQQQGSGGGAAAIGLTAASSAGSPSSATNAAPAAASNSGGWLAEYLPSMLAHSQAGRAPAERSSTAGSAPLSGCLSPYFISDAAAKAAPAVVNIMVQVRSGAVRAGGTLERGMGGG